MSRHSYSSSTWVEVCAFWGMVVAAFSHFFGGLFNALLGWLHDLDPKMVNILGRVANICQLLGSIALLVAIAVPAYQFVKYKSKGWKVFYWIALVLFILGVVFGITALSGF